MRDLEKLADPELGRLMRTPGVRASLLVELDIPRPRVRVERDLSRVGLPGSAVGVVPLDKHAQAEARKRIDEARELISEVTGEQPPWLDSAGAFVVEADSDQLARLADSPLVRRIYLNRVRR